MNDVRSWEDVLASESALVADVCRLGQYCNKLAVSFVKREGNNLAHSLAKFSRSLSDYIVW